MAAAAQYIGYGVAVLFVGWLASQGFKTYRARVVVSCQPLGNRQWFVHVRNGAEKTFVTEYGLGGETGSGVIYVRLHHERELLTRDQKASQKVTVSPHEELDLLPTIHTGMTLLPCGIPAKDNRMRVRPFIRVDGQKRPCRGPWVIYDLQENWPEAE